MYIPRLSSAESLLNETASLVTLPEICLRLRSVLDDPEHSRRQVVNVIRHDPSLTTRLLRIVNSAHFGLAAPVNDVSHALAILGEYELQNLVMVTSIIRKMGTPRNEGLNIGEFWRTSILTAMLARQVAECLNAPAKEEMFVAGLLHNIGQLPLYFREPELFEEVRLRMRDNDCERHEAEREILGYDHCSVGAALAEAWNFSPLLAETIANHHRTPDAIGAMPCRVVGLAAFLSENLDWEQGLELPPGTREYYDGEVMEQSRMEDVLPGIISDGYHGYQQLYEAFFEKNPT